MKQGLRDALKEKRLNHSEALAKSRMIMRRLFLLPEYSNAKTVLFYMSINNEVDTRYMVLEAMKQKKAVLPVTKGGGLLLSALKKPEFTEGRYGVPEPTQLELVKPRQLDLAIVPGIAFDRHGARLGYGKGYYDKLLKHVHAPKLALAFGFQVVDAVPTEPHDVRVNKIVTEDRVIECD